MTGKGGVGERCQSLGHVEASVDVEDFALRLWRFGTCGFGPGVCCNVLVGFLDFLWEVGITN